MRREIHPMVRVVVLLVHDLTQAKISDLDLPADVALGEEDVPGLEVVVNDRWFDLVQVLERRDDLHHDRARLSLGNGLVLLQVEVEVVSVAVLQHRAEGVRIDLEHVVEFHHSRMVQRFMDVVFPQRMPETNIKLIPTTNHQRRTTYLI